MLKGIQKNMILIQMPKGKYFEAAYFVIRSRALDKEARHGEMVREANRIIGEMGLVEESKKQQKAQGRRNKIMFFVYGVLAGAISVALAWLATLIIYL